MCTRTPPPQMGERRTSYPLRVVIRFSTTKEILTVRKFPRTLSLLPRIAGNLSIIFRRSFHMILELGKVTEETQHLIPYPEVIDDGFFTYPPG
jgi:hypothetical protein